MAFFNRFPYHDYNDYNLDWIISTVKDLVEQWTAYHSEWNDWKEDLDHDFSELYDYVHDYFDNLDLTQETYDVIQRLIADGTMQTMIDSAMTDYANQVRVLEARLDIVESGVTPPGTEIVDVRVAYDGVTYTSAGDAVRTQVQDNMYGFGKYNALSVMDMIDSTSGTVNGITWSYDGHGTVTYAGTASSDANLYLIQLQDIDHYLPLDTNYILNFDTGNSDVYVQVLGREPDDTLHQIYSDNSADYVALSIPAGLNRLTIRVLVKAGGPYTGSVYIELMSERENDYGDQELINKALDVMIEADPSSNQALRIRKGPYDSGGVTYQIHDGRIYYVGTRSSSSIFQMLNASDHAPFEAGRTYLISYNGNGVMYLQLIVDGVTLLSGLYFDAEEVTIPDSFTTFNFRVLINDNGTYNSYAPLTIRERGGEYRDLHISSAAALYAFLEDPQRNTRLVLDPITYDLYTGLYETNILADDYTVKYLADIEIAGNGAVISLDVPEAVCLAHETTCNKLAGLSVGGNINAHDLQIRTQNIRYALHDESLGTAGNFYTDHIYTDVYFYHTLTDPVNIGVVGNTIGIGGSMGQHYRFERCTFENPTSRGTFYIHGRTYNVAELSIIACWFVPKGQGHDLVPYQYTGNGVPVPINIVDTRVGNLYIHKDSGGVPQCQWQVTAINSYIARLMYGSDLTGIPTPRRINTLDGTVNTSYDII